MRKRLSYMYRNGLRPVFVMSQTIYVPSRMNQSLSKGFSCILACLRTCHCVKESQLSPFQFIRKSPSRQRRCLDKSLKLLTCRLAPLSQLLPKVWRVTYAVCFGAIAFLSFLFTISSISRYCLVSSSSSAIFVFSFSCCSSTLSLHNLVPNHFLVQYRVEFTALVAVFSSSSTFVFNSANSPLYFPAAASVDDNFDLSNASSFAHAARSASMSSIYVI